MNTQTVATIALFDSELRDEIFLLMELSELKHYTHFTGLHGSSEHGKKEGTVAWPGTNEILLFVLSQEQHKAFKEAVQKYKQERNPPPGLLLFSWSLTELV